MAPWLLNLRAHDLAAYAQVLTLPDSNNIFAEDGSLSKQLVPTDKYLYTIRELMSTEATFLQLIQALKDDFLQPLATVMSDEDKKITHVNIQALHKLHVDFYDELHAACLSAANRTRLICRVFDSFQRLFMKEYVEYFLNIEGALAHFARLMVVNPKRESFRRTFESCRANCKYQNFNFPRGDMLVQPFQRVSKYHLLLKDLKRHKVFVSTCIFIV